MRKESAGTRYGTSGTKIGKALKWAFSEAAGLFLRTTPVGQNSLARFRAPTWYGQSVHHVSASMSAVRWTGTERDTVVDRQQCLNGEGSRADEHTPSLDEHGLQPGMWCSAALTAARKVAVGAPGGS